MSDILFRISNFRRNFSSRSRVDVANLTLKRGGVIGVVGGSGSGKSTLVAALGGLIPRSTSVLGDIEFHPSNRMAVVSTLDDPSLLYERYIGFVLQSDNLLKEQTAESNVALSLLSAKKGSSEYENITDNDLCALFGKVGLREKNVSAKAKTLSGGEAQRVAVVRALIRDPDVVIADEPTGSLDPDVGELVMDALVEFARRPGKTLILVSHDLDSIIAVADRVVVMRDGCPTSQQELSCPKSVAELKDMMGGLGRTDLVANGREKDLTSGLTRKFLCNRLLNTASSGDTSSDTARSSFGLLPALKFLFGWVLRFQNWGDVLLSLAVICLFALLLALDDEVEAKNEKTLSGPELSNVVLGSPGDFTPEDLDNLESSLSGYMRRASAEVESETPDFFGRFEAPIDVKIASVVSTADDGKLDVRCEAPHRELNVAMLAVEEDERGLYQQSFVRGDTIAELNSALGQRLASDSPNEQFTAPLYRDIEDVNEFDGAIVTVQLIKSLYPDYEEVTKVPELICLSITSGKPKPFRVSAIVDKASISANAQTQVIISQEVYQNAFTKELNFKRVALYVDPSYAEDVYDFLDRFKSIEWSRDEFGKQISVERGYGKLREAIRAALFYSRIVEFTFWLSILFVSALLVQSKHSKINLHSASFLVARAFGLRFLRLASYNFLEVIVCCSIATIIAAACWFGFVAPASQSLLLDNAPMETGAVFVYAAMITLGVSLGATFVSAWLWWLTHRGIHDGIRS